MKRLVLLGLLLGGCSTFKAKTPPGSVELEDHEARYDYRATTPDGVVLAVRALPNEPRGDESFWSQAIEGRLRHRGGYALLDSRSVKSADGVAGKQLRFGHDEGARPHLYYLTLFVTEDHIFLVEAGGAKDLVERETAKIDAFVSGFVAN